jgi:hypothetical protein
VEAAFWCRIGEREHLRWALPGGADAAMDAFARLSVEPGGVALTSAARYVGAFRALGLLMPVWDLAPGTGAAGCVRPVNELNERIAATMADPRPLQPEERRARAGLVGRQMFLR